MISDLRFPLMRYNIPYCIGSCLEIIHVSTVPRASRPNYTCVPTESIRIRIISDPRLPDPDPGLRAHAHLDILRLIHELLFNGHRLPDKEMTGALERVGGIRALVGLDL